MSTSPGEPRSSHGTRRARSDRAPSSGIASQAGRPARRDGRARRRTTPRRSRPSPAGGEHALTERGREPRPVREHDDGGLGVLGRPQPAAERGPGPRAHSGHRTTLQQSVASVELVGARDDHDLREGRLGERPRGRTEASSTCLGEPNRVAAPAARTSAPITPRRRARGARARGDLDLVRRARERVARSRSSGDSGATAPARRLRAPSRTSEPNRAAATPTSGNE